MPKSLFKEGRTQVRVSNAGQVSIPKRFRQAMRLEQGTILEVEALHGRLIFTPKVLADREGHEAYEEAKDEERAGRLSGPFDAEQADSRLEKLSRARAVSKRVSKKRRKR